MRFLPKRFAVCLAALVLLVPALSAQRSDKGRRVTDLNNDILRVYSRAVRGGGADSSMREQAQELLTQRQEALAALAAESPDEALASALPPGLAADLAEAFPESAARVERHGSLIGILEIEVEDGEDLQDHRVIHTVRVGRDRFRVQFSGDGPEAEAGSLLRVDGMMVGETMVAESSEMETEANAAQSCSTTGVQRIAVVKAKFPGTSPALANATLDDWLFGSSGMTVNNYWEEASYGAAWADGDIYPAGSDAWYTLDREYSCSESTSLREAAMDAADGDINYQNYQRVVIVFPKPSSGCSFAGRASIGCWVSSPDGNTVSYALQVITSMGTAQKTVQLTTHEAGHNLGLRHSSSADFGSEPLGPTNAPGSRSEYGDRYSTMGSWNEGHYAAEQKNQLGWLSPSVVNSSTNASVKPFSNGSGVRALNIKRGSSGSQRLWLEFRRQLGDFNASPPQDPSNGALIRLGNGSSQSLLLDFTPGSSSNFLDAPLESGQTWDDPYSDLSISIGSASDSGLQVEVGYGNTPTCSTNPPTINVSPNSSSADYPAGASYTVTVQNNDSSACNSSSFTMTSNAFLSGSPTSEVSTSISNEVLTIAPGGSSSTTLTATPSVLPPEARNYVLSAKAARAEPEQSAEDEVGFTVVPPLQCETGEPWITLSPVSRTAQFPGSVSYTATVGNNDNSECDASTFAISSDAFLDGLPTDGVSTSVGNGSLSVPPGSTRSTTITVAPNDDPLESTNYLITARAARSEPEQAVEDESSFTVTPQPTCEAGLPTVSLSPNNRSVEFPNAANYTVSITNNDNEICETSVFSLNSVASGDVATSVSSSAISIAPGATKTSTLTATPTTLPEGSTNYEITARVSRPSPEQLVEDDSLLTVSPPEVCSVSLPTLQLSPTNEETEFPNPVSYFVTLTNNDSESCSASTFSLTSNALFGGEPTSEASASIGNPALTLEAGAVANTTITATPLILPEQARAYVVTARAARAGQEDAAEGEVGFTVVPPPSDPPPPPPVSSVTLSVQIVGGRGSVVIEPLGLICDDECTTTVPLPEWTPLTLEASGSGRSCVQEIRGCDASGNSCSLTTAQDYEIVVEMGRCSRGSAGKGKGRVKRLAETTSSTSTGRGRRR